MRIMAFSMHSTDIQQKLDYVTFGHVDSLFAKATLTFGLDIDAWTVSAGIRVVA